MAEITPIDLWGGTRNGWNEMDLPASCVWVHHSVTTASDNADADFQILDDIGLSQGHGGISYSYVIHPNGTIGEGQATARGAHTGGQGGCGGSPWGWNICSFGICLVGNYQKETPTRAAIDAFRWLYADLVARQVLVADAPIGGHRDAPGNSTACPGNNIEAILNEFRAPIRNVSPTEVDMVIAWGRTVFGVPIAFLLAGGRVLKTFDGPPGAYGITQSALDWKNATGRDAVPLILVDPDQIGQLAAPWPTGSTKPGTVPAALSDPDIDRIAKKVADTLSGRLAS